MKDNEFQSIFEIHLKGGTTKVNFPSPEGLAPINRSIEHKNIALEHYLLARYSFLHNMHSTFMTNTFWAVENLILSILVFKYKTKEELGQEFEFHSITKYWEEAKRIIPGKANLMNGFDGYISQVKGYFNERYPVDSKSIKVTHASTSKTPILKDSKNKKIKPGPIYSLKLSHIDHFINFILYEVPLLSRDPSKDLEDYLIYTKNKELYIEDNEHSIIYPMNYKNS